MDCGDGVTVHIFSDRSCEHSDNGLELTTGDSHSRSLQTHHYPRTDPEHIPSNVGENLEYVTPAGKVQVTLLHPRSYEFLEEMQNSIHSVTSSGNNGIEIATSDTIGFNYSMQSSSENKDKFLVDELTDIPTPLSDTLSATLKSDVESSEQNFINELENSRSELQKQPQTCPSTQLQHRESISCGIEESTEVLLVNSTECDDKYFGGGRAYSGTDSDVEVLMSEEIVESDWSAEDTATDDLGQTPDEPGGGLTEKVPQIILGIKENCLQHSKTNNSATDQEISVEDFSRGSNSASEQPGREQLFKIISEQATHIHKLECTIERYQRTHQTLVKHVEALRLALDLNEANDQRSSTN